MLHGTASVARVPLPGTVRPSVAGPEDPPSAAVQLIGEPAGRSSYGGGDTVGKPGSSLDSARQPFFC